MRIKVVFLDKTRMLLVGPACHQPKVQRGKSSTGPIAFSCIFPRQADRVAFAIAARSSGENTLFGIMQWTVRGGTEVYTLPV
jgi:hypothetical protein